MKTILILAAGTLQLHGIKTAKRMGLRVIVADGNAHAPGLALADVPYVVNILDPEACLAVARKEKVDGVVHMCSEVSMFPMGRINEELGLHGIDSATAVRCTNKARMRRAFEDGGAPSPKSICALTLDESFSSVSEIGMPVIFKPSRNSGSRGVTRLTEADKDEQIKSAFEYALKESRDNSVVIEQYVEGPEFSVEILVWNGQPHILAVTDKETTGAPHFVETGHCQPSRRTTEERLAIEQAAFAGVKALGIDWAAAHAEVKLTIHGPMLMEIGARMGGDYITTELVPRSTGIDMTEGAIRLALGEIPDLTPKHGPRGASIRYLTPPAGKVIAISGIERAKAMPGVKIIELDVSVGGSVPPITSSLARIGHVIAEGDSADEAVANAEAARDAVKIKTEPEQV